MAEDGISEGGHSSDDDGVGTADGGTTPITDNIGDVDPCEVVVVDIAGAF